MPFGDFTSDCSDGRSIALRYRKLDTNVFQTFRATFCVCLLGLVHLWSQSVPACVLGEYCRSYELDCTQSLRLKPTLHSYRVSSLYRAQ